MNLRVFGSRGVERARPMARGARPAEPPGGAPLQSVRTRRGRALWCRHLACHWPARAERQAGRLHDKNTMQLLAPAKINLHLRVGRRRGDGFHPLLTWMCTVGLFDRLTLEADPDAVWGTTSAHAGEAGRPPDAWRAGGGVELTLVATATDPTCRATGRTWSCGSQRPSWMRWGGKAPEPPRRPAPGGGLPSGKELLLTRRLRWDPVPPRRLGQPRDRGRVRRPLLGPRQKRPRGRRERSGRATEAVASSGTRV